MITSSFMNIMYNAGGLQIHPNVWGCLPITCGAPLFVYTLLIIYIPLFAMSFFFINFARNKLRPGNLEQVSLRPACIVFT